MTTITLDDGLIKEVIAVSHYQNAQEAVIKILADYLQHHKNEQPLFDKLRMMDDCSDDDFDQLLERNKDTGRLIEL